MELAFAVAEDGVFTLAEAGGDGAGDGPEAGGVADVEAGVEVGAQAGVAAGDSASEGAGSVAADGGGAEGVEGVQRLEVAVVREGGGGAGGEGRGGGLFHDGRAMCGVQLVLGEAVDGGDFTGEGAEGGGLNVFVVGDLFHVGVVGAEALLLAAEVVDRGHFDEHVAVLAGHSGDGKHADYGGRDEDVGVVEGDRDLVEVAVLVAADEYDVEAFLQKMGLFGCFRGADEWRLLIVICVCHIPWALLEVY